MSSLQSHTKIPTHFSAFEGTWVVKWDRTTRKSITLIEADKNTNCALLNCWHWTGWIRQRILTTGDRLEGTVERPCHGASAPDGFEVGHDKKKKRKTSSSDLLVWSLLMYYKVIYTLRYINSVKKFKTISPTLWKLKIKKKNGQTKTPRGKVNISKTALFSMLKPTYQRWWWKRQKYKHTHRTGIMKKKKHCINSLYTCFQKCGFVHYSLYIMFSKAWHITLVQLLKWLEGCFN